MSASILFAETYSIDAKKDRAYIKEVAEKVELPEFVPKKGVEK